MQSILSFYKKVYEQELNSSKKMHLHSSRIIKKYFVSKQEEVLTEEHPYQPLSDKQGSEITKILALRGGEVQLKYYALARISSFVSLNKYESTRVYPLFVYDATVLLKDGLYYLSIDVDSRSFIKTNLSSKISDNLLFKKLLLTSKIDFHFASSLAEIISKETPNATIDELLMFPDLWTQRKVNARLKKAFEISEEYIPLGTLAIVEKENNSFTTFDELSKIDAKTASAPLKVLFENAPNVSDEKMGIICEELNKSQYQAIENSNSKIVSVISGPPGTGKSFTIANLAAEKVSKGKSILITSKNREALDVIERKIKDQVGIKNLCVNPSQDSKFAWMKDHLEHVLGRSYQPKGYSMDYIEAGFNQFEKLHNTHLRKEKELIQQFDIEYEYTNKLNASFINESSDEFRQRVYSHRSKNTIPLWQGLNDYYQKISKIRSTAISLIQKVNHFMLEESMSYYRADLRHYLSFLRARTSARKIKLQEAVNYEAVLKAFPVWLVRANDISRVLPLKNEVFDVLIIDEASQCDIPSLLPLIQRAKKVVIVGDSRQLSHISFLSKAFENECKHNVAADLKHLCQHRDHSILDLASGNLDPQACIQLNEHFRSQFPIIAFSNKQFYNDRLSVLTKRPISIANSVQFVPTSGTRTSGYNKTETDTILNKVRSIIETERDLPKKLKTTIGILSPFRKQVDYLFKILVETFSISEIKKHQIVIGTAFTFQGNERDVMLLSLALDNSAVGGSFTFLNRNDVFNVSITRARNEQFIYYSFDPKNLNPKSTLAHFFRFYENDLVDDKGKVTQDEFCLEVQAIFKAQHIPTWTNFNISGVSIDLIVKIDTHYIGFDLVGYDGEMKDYYSLERYKMIERGKIKLYPLPYALWKGDQKQCTNFINDLIVQYSKEHA